MTTTYSAPSFTVRTALYFLSEENWTSSIRSLSSDPNSLASTSTVRLRLPVHPTNIRISFLASASSIAKSIFLNIRRFVVMVPVLSIHTVFTWLIDSTELDL